MTLEEKREQLAESKRKTGKFLKIALAMFVGGGLLNTVIGSFLEFIKANENIIEAVPKFFAIIIYGATIPLVLAIRNGLKNRKIQSEYEKEYKANTLTPIFNEYFDNCVYNNEDGISSEYIQKTNIVPNDFNVYSSNDKISGVYKGIKVERADVYIQKRVRKKDKTDTHTYFKGQVYVFDFNKSFSHQMQVIDKTDIYAIGNKSFFSSNLNNKIETENLEFNKVYNVYTAEDIEAFYLLTPTIMEAMLEIKKKLNKQISFSFLDNKLVICLESLKDAFEINYKETITTDEKRLKEEAKYEMQLILSFINTFDLESDIFKTM